MNDDQTNDSRRDSHHRDSRNPETGSDAEDSTDPENDDVDETRIVEIDTDEVDEVTGRRVVRSAKSISRTVRSNDRADGRPGGHRSESRDPAARALEREERHRRREAKRARRAAREQQRARTSPARAGSGNAGSRRVDRDRTVVRGHRGERIGRGDRGGRTNPDRDRRRDDRRSRRVDWDDPVALECHQRELEQRVADLTAEIFHIRDRVNHLR